MLQVNQEFLAHDTNIAVVKIRNSELIYFQSFFTGFGLTAAILASFNMNTMSQTLSYDATCSQFWLFFYWINNSLGSVFGFMAVLIALMNNVYGQGLALRGPTGSMVKAIDGMVVEQQRFLLFFSLSTIATAFNFIGDFFVMMLEDGAWASGVIVILGMGAWYVAIVRIINRFQHQTSKDKFATMNQTEEFNHEFGGVNYSPMIDEAEKVANSRSMQGNNKKLPSRQQQMILDQETGELVPMYAATGGAKSSPDTQLATQYQANISIKSLKGAWARSYMVIKGCFALYYKSKQAFEQAPMEPINGRPLVIADFDVDCNISAEYYSITLTPVDEDDERKPIEFRCDTEQEMHNWKIALLRAKTTAGKSGRSI